MPCSGRSSRVDSRVNHVCCVTRMGSASDGLVASCGSHYNAVRSLVKSDDNIESEAKEFLLILANYSDLRKPL